MAIDDETVTPAELPPITEEAVWVEHTPAIVSDVLMQAKEDGTGVMNFQARVMDARTRYLKKQVEELLIQGINVIGKLNSEAELDAIDTTDLKKGDSYFVEGALCVWNLLEWINSGSLLGPRGITLLGTWPDNQQLPDVNANTIGDGYVWKRDLWLLVPGVGEEPRTWVSIGLEGPEGMSAYQVAKDNGFPGTQPEWLASLVGKSAYQTWRDQGNTGTQAQFLASLVGKDAYQMWLTIPENEGKTLEEFFEAFRGHQGLQWKGPWGTGLTFIMGDAVTHLGSSYISTLVGNNIGREPAPGVPGWGVLALKGDKGDPATPFSVMGSKPNVGALPRPGAATEAWYVGSKLYIWVTALDDYVDLDGIGGMSAYELAVQDGFEGTLQEWLVSLKGPDAYQVWKTKPGNEDKTIEQFFADIKGKSSYQSWLDQGNTGSEAVFVASLKSTTPGPQGPAKAPFKVMGSKATEGLLPTPGLEDQAWFVGQNLYVWVESEQQYADIGSMGGIDAYEVAKNNGFVGTVQEWLASLKSTEKGPIGPQGRNLVVKGTVADAAALDGISNPENADAYVTRDNGHLHSYYEGAFIDLGPFRGTDGTNGKSAYQIWLDNEHSGSEIEFLTSLKGKDGTNGTDGKSVIIRGAVVTFSELPANPEEQWVYAVRDVNTLYCWITNGWVSLGAFRGENGTDGRDGSSISVIKVLTPEDSSIPDAVANPNKAYISLEKRIMLSVNGEWEDAGPVGVGEPGPQGTGIKLRGIVANVSSLPNKNNVAEGDGWFTQVDKKLYVLTDGEWAGPFDITGLPGKDGEQGPEGQPGKSIAIMGHFDTLALLAAAHPTGTLGDGYLIGTGDTPRELGIWSVEDGGKWINVGVIQGPPGKQGIPGPIGIGRPGEKGPRGSSWITLPVGQDAPSAGFTGLVGDWAVSDSFKVYYKTADRGWVYWGQLVAGDVNSPELALGKMVRLGNEWVPLLVDEAPNDGDLYGRSKPENDDPGAWIRIPKGTTDITVKDGKLYGRSFAVDGETPEWVEIVLPKDYAKDLLVDKKDGKFYARVWETNADEPYWKEVVLPTAGVDEAPDIEGKVFLRSGNLAAWVEYLAGVQFPTGGNDGKTYVFKNGAWIEFNTYDVAITTLTATGNVDALTTGFVIVTNTGATAKTITLSDGPKAPARAKVLVVKVNGAAGAVTFAATGATALVWNNGTAPSLTGSRNYLTFTWDGVEWVGAAGAVVP